jgi:hypothetical protein
MLIRNGLTWKERKQNHWLSTEARVQSITIEDWSLVSGENFGDRYRPSMTYSYTVDGRQYEHTQYMRDLDNNFPDRAGHNVINFISGQYFTLDKKTFFPSDKSITIYYDVEDPSISLTAEPSSPKFNDNLTIFVGALLALFGSAMILLLILRPGMNKET